MAIRAPLMLVLAWLAPTFPGTTVLQKFGSGGRLVKEATVADRGQNHRVVLF